MSLGSRSKFNKANTSTVPITQNEDPVGGSFSTQTRFSIGNVEMHKIRVMVFEKLKTYFHPPSVLSFHHTLTPRVFRVVCETSSYRPLLHLSLLS